MKSIWIGTGFSHHSVPSLSNTATRSSTGTGSAPSWPHVVATNSRIACFARPSRQLDRAPFTAPAPCSLLTFVAMISGSEPLLGHDPARRDGRADGRVVALVLVGIGLRERGQGAVERVPRAEIAGDRDGVAGPGVSLGEGPAADPRVDRHDVGLQRLHERRSLRVP